MPELPEVEWSRRLIARHALGRAVREVALVDAAVVRAGLSTRPGDADPRAVARVETLVGDRTEGLDRHGKRLLWRFGRSAWLVHLGMTGSWTVGERPRFARFGLGFDEGWLWFADARRFGAIAWVQPEVGPLALRAGHGPDGLDEPMDGPALQARLSGRRPVKVALMDPSVIAGLGNIHAVEILFELGLSPERPCDRLTPAEVSALAAEIPRWLAGQVSALCAEDSLVYVNAGGENTFRVYGREGQPCPRCGGGITRATHGGRSTFWCTTCQG